MEKIKYSFRQIAEILFVTLGFNIVMFRNKSKEPTGAWKEYQFKRQPESELTKHRWHLATGVGIILGPVSHVYAFDLDKAESFDVPVQLLEKLGLTKSYPWIVKSGSGLGWHIYFKSGDLLKKFNDTSVITIKDPVIKCKQIELRLRCVIVAPGSQHESGGTYEFVNQNDFLKPMAMLEVSKIVEVVDWLQNIITPEVISEPKDQVKEDLKAGADQANTSSEDKTKPIDPETEMAVRDCIEQLFERKISLSHDYDKWRDAGFSIANEFGEKGRDLFHLFSSLSPKYKKDECDKAFTKYLEAQRNGKANKKTIRSFFWMCRRVGVKPRGGNRRELSPDKNNQFSASVEIIFARHKIYRCVFTDTIYVDGQPLDDRIINSIYVLLMSRYYFKKMNKDFIHSLLESEYVEERHRITDLVKDYKPVNEKGNIKMLSATLITNTGENIKVTWRGERRPFLEVIVELFLVKMIKQFYEPVANDICLVLLGAMSIGKTFWLTHLLPETLADLCRITQFTNDKDFKVQLTESALLVIDEIREKDMSSNEYMKMVMTTPEFSLRVPYARKPRLRRRIATLAGTGNNMFILRDPTGNRRFVPLWLENINRELFSKINRMDLFYEAYTLYKSGYDTVVNAELVEAISNISKDFEVRTEADELLLEWCPPADPKDANATLMSVAEIRDLILERTKKTLNFYQVGVAVDRLGYVGKTEAHITFNNKISKVWKYYCDVESKFHRMNNTTEDDAPESLPGITSTVNQGQPATRNTQDDQAYFLNQNQK